MGILSQFFAKRAEREYNQRSLHELDDNFSMSFRLLNVDLCVDVRNFYSSQMDDNAARALAAQVVNFLKGEDIDEIARVSEEPLRSRIMAILPKVRQSAAEYMQADRKTREIIVATLRMTSVLNFWKYETAWLESLEKMRIERLLVEYGPEFPQEITPAAYMQLFAAYHAVKRTAWGAK